MYPKRNESYLNYMFQYKPYDPIKDTKEKQISASQKIRKKVFKILKRECQMCGENRTHIYGGYAGNIIVHHRHYRNVGHEVIPDDICVLCKNCHKDLHERQRFGKLGIKDLPFVDPLWFDEIWGD